MTKRKVENFPFRDVQKNEIHIDKCLFRRKRKEMIGGIFQENERSKA